MMQLVQVSVENEMDLTLAYKKSIKAAELLLLSLSTQTAFATAVSEVCREVIDKTHDGLLSLEIQQEGERYSLVAIVTYRTHPEMGSLEEGFKYARKLVPVFNSSNVELKGRTELKLSIPRSSRINQEKMLAVRRHFMHLEPTSAYEEIRLRNMELVGMNEQTSIALEHSAYLNDQKNEFLSVASHELKTPLTILRAFTQMALKTDCSPATLGHLKKVDAQAQKLQTMIQQLLDISKIEQQDVEYLMEEVEFNPFLSDMIDLIKQLVPGNELVVNLTGNATVMLDKLRIEQVIMNIVGNAAKYSKPGLPIELNSEVDAASNVRLTIKDKGIGMSEDELEKVFSKFYRIDQVSKKYNGLGMGLYISAKIITGHAGKIWVESKEGHGSSFIITLPALK